MAEENWYWLGTNPIERPEDRVIVPRAVVDTGLLAPHGEVYWARDAVYDAVTVSRVEKPFGDDRYEQLGTTRIGEEPVVSIPAAVLATTGDFEPGAPVHFATTDELGAAACCLVLSSAEADALLEGAQAMAGSVDSGYASGGP